MPYSLHRRSVQEVIVEARINAQQIINVFHLFTDELVPENTEAGSSATLLQSFRTAFSALILPRMYDTYEIAQYTIAEITGSFLRERPPKPSYVIATYDPRKRDRIAGIVTDRGQLVANKLLPTHEALRAYKQPRELARGYFSGNYWRFCQFSEDDHADAVPEWWQVTFTDAWNQALRALNDTIFSDGTVAPFIPWKLCLWSADFHKKGLTPPPTGVSAYLAARRIQTVTCSQYVGTQVSRRFEPGGTPRGM